MNPKILIIEEEARLLDQMRDALEQHFGSSCVQYCCSVFEAKEQDLLHVDLVLTSMDLPDGSALDVVENLLVKRNDLPIVVMADESIIELAIQAIKQGAYDCIIRGGDWLTGLPFIVEKNLAVYIVKMENEQLRKRLERTLDQLRVKNEQLEMVVEKLEDIAATDPLTGLANRRAFARALGRYFAASTRDDTDLACIMIDLDGFKALNDTLGHQNGDKLLQHTSRVLQQFLRRSDLAGRFGGDEFVLLLPNTNQQRAIQVAERIQDEFRKEISRQIMDEHDQIKLSMSMGLATLRVSEAKSPQALIECADKTLYAAKRSGKDQLLVYQPKRTAKV
ncbi:Diguanylate cyclase DosC [Poriferisphaera corsica]|uniref:diguanylate cyclase n=1 Tax=Poriferisphaera corsica TaxID=2528020 RepID=A0A517YYT6_9BACT|nr:diguanylate cyclase [Poriferisphaera corsica]QDU35377.1 Diguanylate cyclase DosC [Poriferisphaera corsica]